MVILCLYYRVVILRTMALHHVTNCKRILRMIVVDKQLQIKTFKESKTGNNLASLMTQQ